MDKQYIDADALLKWYDDERKKEYDRLSEYKKPSSRAEAKIKIGVLDKLYFKICELKEQGSAADVQEVVRCKDCKYLNGRDDNLLRWCNKLVCGTVKDDFFCADGAKMDGGEKNES